MSTRDLHDAISRRYPVRAGRRINTTSTLLVELMKQGWVAGEKRGGSRWWYRAAVSRAEALTWLARLAVAEFSETYWDAWFLVYAALGAVLPRRPTVRPAGAA